MATSKRQELIEQITDLCAGDNCSEKMQKLHLAQYVDRGWNPHPTAEFIEWWKQHPDHAINGVPTNVVYNCRVYRDAFLEAKQYGVA